MTMHAKNNKPRHKRSLGKVGIGLVSGNILVLEEAEARPYW